ncbi:MAG: hypothetical protein FJW90_12030 [Actinobacteria bacterium]|nr:hypothetical protein [Actinomycetota bacterium]
MPRKRRDNAERLRNAVEALPRHTKQGMLRGIGSNRVIVGSYTDDRGGVCPMLAAHRNGGRTDFGTFAEAWDAFTGARKPRRASAREVRTLRGYLEVSLIRDGIAPLDSGAPASPWAERPLAEEVREVQASRRRRAAAEASEHAGVTIEQLLERAYLDSEHAEIEASRPGANVSASAPGSVEPAV